MFSFALTQDAGQDSHPANVVKLKELTSYIEDALSGPVWRICNNGWSFA